MNTLLKLSSAVVVGSFLSMGSVAMAEDEHAHFDIAPYLVNGQLLTGGLDHSGNAQPPSITVYGYEFGEDPADPFNPSDPGVNQAAGLGNLPAGASLRYDILSSLLYWDGSGTEVNWTTPTGDTHIQLWMGTSMRIIDGDSGPQAGSLVQSVASNGTVHKHFVTSLLADDTASNVPGDANYVEPAAGLYAYSIELTLTSGQNVYTSDPVWIVFNNGLSEEAHDMGMTSLVPEPASLGLLGLGAMGLLARRRK